MVQEDRHEDNEMQDAMPEGRFRRRGAKRKPDGAAEGVEAKPKARMTRAQAQGKQKEQQKRANEEDSDATEEDSQHTLNEQRDTGGLPRFAVKPCEPLNKKALSALSRQDAITYNGYVKQIRHDDVVAEVASQRGQLVEFVIGTLFSQDSDIVVETPEYMTVEYLKMRIVKAKLMREEFLDPSKFVLRKKTLAENGTIRIEDVSSHTSTGEDVFLFNLGYEALGRYEMFMASAPPTTDKEQQDRLLAMAGASEVSERRHAEPVSPERAAYQAMLMPVKNKPEHRAVAVSPAQAVRQAMPLEHLPQHPLVPGPVADGAAALGPNQDNLDGQDGSEPKKLRRQTGRWTDDETAALIEGVMTFSTSWAQIHERYVLTGRINQHRTPVDLKDKWRNLVKMVKQPNTQSRGKGLDEETMRSILRIINTPEMRAEPPEMHPPFQQLQEVAAQLQMAEEIEQQQQQQQQVPEGGDRA